jgi:hypothetical protein
MGFISTANTTTLTAKLTPFGRQKMVSTNNALIATFSLGDSDANYYVPLTLSTGEIPAKAGEDGANSTFSNSTAQNVSVKSPIIVNPSGLLRKPVETQSVNISTDLVFNGFTTISGTSLTRLIIDRNDYNTDSLVNLYYSFGLPLNSSEDNTYTGVTYAVGGYSDTALSAISQTKILAIAIDNSTYGECIDGKSIKVELPTTAGTYTIYSTYQNYGIGLTTQDANIRDTSPVTNYLGDNTVMLFSDNILTPNGGSGPLSWATGYGTQKPFSVNRKQQYNLQTNSGIGLTADTIVGIAYLDKGFIVITNPQILADYDATTASSTTVTFDSVSTSVYQNVTCIANRGEFGVSTNRTFSESDTVRISELGLYDNLGNLLAVAKTDRQITKNINEFLALSVKIYL